MRRTAILKNDSTAEKRREEEAFALASIAHYYFVETKTNCAPWTKSCVSVKSESNAQPLEMTCRLKYASNNVEKGQIWSAGLCPCAELSEDTFIHTTPEALACKATDANFLAPYLSSLYGIPSNRSLLPFLSKHQSWNTYVLHTHRQKAKTFLVKFLCNFLLE